MGVLRLQDFVSVRLGEEAPRHTFLAFGTAAGETFAGRKVSALGVAEKCLFVVAVGAALCNDDAALCGELRDGGTLFRDVLSEVDGTVSCVVVTACAD